MRARPDVHLPWGIVPVALVAGAAGIGAGRLAGVHPVVEVLAGTCVYAVVLAALGRFPPELGHALRVGRTADGTG
jgi:hypothetical protein